MLVVLAINNDPSLCPSAKFLENPCMLAICPTSPNWFDICAVSCYQIHENWFLVQTAMGGCEPRANNVCECMICIGMGLLMVNVLPCIVLVLESIKQEVHEWPSCLVDNQKYIMKFLINSSLRGALLFLPLVQRGAWHSRWLIFFIQVEGFILGLFPQADHSTIIDKCWRCLASLMWSWCAATYTVTCSIMPYGFKLSCWGIWKVEAEWNGLWTMPEWPWYEV